jgi:hypothetical protein
MSWLYILVVILLAGGLVLIFGRDWVWQIDSRSEAHERDAEGNPIRTEKWDKMHRLQGIVMVVMSIVLGGLIYFFT